MRALGGWSLWRSSDGFWSNSSFRRALEGLSTDREGAKVGGLATLMAGVKVLDGATLWLVGKGEMRRGDEWSEMGVKMREGDQRLFSLLRFWTTGELADVYGNVGTTLHAHH